MKSWLPAVLLIIGWAFPVQADERILAFHSDIEVRADGSMQVTETIHVRAERREIKRGIYRDFPTDYRDAYGNRYRVEFDVLQVKRNGRAEDWHTTRKGNGIRVYMGHRDRQLKPGVYSYALTYRTDRQLGFFADHDELYWNVTGNDWSLPIDAASATVDLPPGIPLERLVPEAYTGFRGEQGNDYLAEIHADGSVDFTATRPLAAGEGLTIVVAWPKGYVAEPTQGEQVARLLRDNRPWLVGLAGLAVLFGYFGIAWLLVGRDPEAGVIITRYEPPPDLTPATVRFIERMGYDHQAFAAALVHLAVRGLIDIEEQDGTFVLRRTAKPAESFVSGEKVLLKNLFGGGTLVTLKRSEHKRISKAIKAHKKALTRNYEKVYFLTNRRWLLPGILLAVLAFGAVIAALPDGGMMASGAFLCFWLTGWTIGVVMLGRQVWSAWRRADSALTMLGALFVTAFATPFFAAEVIVIGMLGHQVSPALPVVLIGGVAGCALFYRLLKAPTRAGRRLLDQIAGFRDYLQVAERDEMNFRNPPDKTPALFERYLPYALALGVEQPWAERFAGLFRRLESQGEVYRPGWYHGSRWSGQGIGDFSRSLGSSLGAAVASSATAPGSSSGSGGGGSSGGGGGGGGGGGW